MSSDRSVLVEGSDLSLKNTQKDKEYWSVFDYTTNILNTGTVTTPAEHTDPGHGSSKLTSLVNILLNFQKLISQICQYFVLKKCSPEVNFSNMPIFCVEKM